MGGEDGAVAVDLVNMKAFSMDEESWTATFGPGFELGDLDEELDKHGRAISHGICPTVGIGGHATIGGIGPSSRLWGTALDHIEEVEVVTADGEIRRASYTENADLFFGLKGAGASFGIITEFKARTEPEPGQVVQYTYGIHVGTSRDMGAVFKQWQALVADPDLDRRFSTFLILQPLGAIVTGVFHGTQEEYEATDIPGRMPEGGPLDIQLLSWLGSLAHVAESGALGIAGTPAPFTGRSLAFGREDLVGDDDVDAIFGWIDDTADKGTPIWTVYFDAQGGAIDDYADGNSYPHRGKLYMYQSYAIGPSVSDQMVDFVEGLDERFRAAAPLARTTYAGYINPTLNRTAANELYWGEMLPRLREVKKTWDPTSVFRNPQSVEPAE